MKTVRLFREASSSARYEEALRAAGYSVSFQAPLIFQHITSPDLQAALARPDSYSGLILTSVRATQALDAIDDLSALIAPWREKPCYTVGPATAEVARQRQLHVVGEEAGTAESLGEVIARDVHDLPLLFLCGERHRPELPAMLDEMGQRFENCVVYKSLPAEITLDPDEAPEWAVFFSPVGAEVVLGAWQPTWQAASLAAIGTTTASYLTGQGKHVSAIAASPTPQALTEAIRQADQVHV